MQLQILNRKLDFNSSGGLHNYMEIKHATQPAARVKTVPQTQGIN